MKSQTVLFFATKSDFLQVILEIEKQFSLNFYKFGHYDSNKITPISSMNEFEKLGHLSNDDSAASPKFIVLPKELAIFSRQINLNTGDIVYSIDRLLNPDSLIIKLSGICENRENTMLVGSVDIQSDDALSKKIFNAIFRLIKKHYKKIGRAYVGNESMDLLKKGWRLTQIASSPVEYDLRIE